MSGPKVVRIVTRDEIIAICKGHLTALNKAVQEWTTFCQQNGVATDEEIAATGARQAALTQLLAEDQFSKLQKAVPDEIAFLKSDRQTRLERAAEKKAKASSNQRRTEAAATGVLSALDQKGKSVPAELRSSLEQIAAGRNVDTAALSRAFALLTDEKPATISEHQRELASAHQENEVRQSFNEWLAETCIDVDNEFARLDLRLAELTLVIGEEAATDFKERLKTLSLEQPSGKRSLLIDSLELDLAQAVSNAKKRRDLEQRLATLAAQLSEIGSEEAERWSRTITAQREGTFDSLLKLEEKARQVLDQAVKEIAARSRRQAVLEGLAELGYQVSEGMETAWVQDGSVVLKRTLESGYGVEIIGNIDSGRVQMRTVAFRRPDLNPDKSSDTAAETEFCGAIAKLQEEFAAEGNEIVIERAAEIGATALKVISETDAAEEEFRGVLPPINQQRSIK